MNWRGRPLASHEVIVQAITAATTATGLRVRAELDTSAYDTGVKVSDRQMDALPLTRHDWHGELHPPSRGLRPGRRRPGSVRPAQPRPGLAGPPGVDRLCADEWDALIAVLMTLHDQQREIRTADDLRALNSPALRLTGLRHRHLQPRLDLEARPEVRVVSALQDRD